MYLVWHSTKWVPCMSNIADKNNCTKLDGGHGHGEHGVNGGHESQSTGPMVPCMSNIVDRNNCTKFVT